MNIDFLNGKNLLKKLDFKTTSEIMLKTDSPENRKHKNDNNLCEILINYVIGGFGNRAIGFVLTK